MNAGCSLAPKSDKSDRLTRAREKTAQNQSALLAAYRELGRITAACTIAKIHRDSHYRWLKNDAQYATEFIRAQEPTTEPLKDQAVQVPKSDTILEPYARGRDDWMSRSDWRCLVSEAYLVKAEIDARVASGEVLTELEQQMRDRLNRIVERYSRRGGTKPGLPRRRQRTR
jgi:hypothetical protein